MCKQAFLSCVSTLFISIGSELNARILGHWTLSHNACDQASTRIRDKPLHQADLGCSQRSLVNLRAQAQLTVPHSRILNQRYKDDNCHGVNRMLFTVKSY